MTYEGEAMARSDRGRSGNRTVRVAQAQLRARGPLLERETIGAELVRYALAVLGVLTLMSAWTLARIFGVIP